MWSREELGREVGHDAGIPLGIGFQCSHALLENTVPDGQGQSGVEVVGRCGPGNPAHTAKKVIKK